MPMADSSEVFMPKTALRTKDVYKRQAMYKKDIAPNLEAGNMLMFAHGFAIHFGQILSLIHIFLMHSTHGSLCVSLRRQQACRQLRLSSM